MTLTNDKCIKQAVKYLFDVDFLYFEDLSSDSEKLPEDMDINYKDQVLADFQKKINNIFSRLHEPYNFSYETLMDAQKKLDRIVYPAASIKKLEELYLKAKTRTLLEILFTTNKKDIIAFYHALQDVTVWDCRVWLEERIKDLIKDAPKNDRD